MSGPTPKAQYLYSRHVTPLRSYKLPRLYGKTQKSIQNRPSSECLIRHPTELAIRPNTAHPEVIIDSNNVYVRKQSQGFSGDDDYDLSDCETDLGEDDSEVERYYTDETSQYRYLCEQLGIIPCSTIIRQLKKTWVNLSYSQMTSLDIRAFSTLLISNTKITALNVSNNDLGSKGVIYLAEVIAENIFINKLEMSAVNLDETGFKAIAGALLGNRNITYLDISKNNIGKRSAKDLAWLLRRNDFIEHLDLSGNLIDDVTGTEIGPAIASNLTLKFLDLSWNHIRRHAARVLVESICKNVELESVNLSWNGLAEFGCRAFEKHFPKNHTLKSLDISHNRIGFHTLGYFLKGLKDNDTLQELKIYGNPITSDGALTILTVFENSTRALKEINIQDIPIDGRFKTKAWELIEKKELKIKHGDLRKKPAPLKERGQSIDDFNPLLVLFEHMRQQNLRLIDLFRNLDANNDHSITSDEIQAGLAKFNVSITDSQTEQLVNSMDRDKNGAIDFSELVQGKKYVNKIRRSSKAVGNDTLAEMLEGLEKLMKKERIQSQAKKSAERRERRASRLPLLREKT